MNTFVKHNLKDMGQKFEIIKHGSSISSGKIFGFFSVIYGHFLLKRTGS
jgi:hypothetical protein